MFCRIRLGISGRGLAKPWFRQVPDRTVASSVAHVMTGLLWAVALIGCGAPGDSELEDGGIVHPDPARYVLSAPSHHVLERVPRADGMRTEVAFEIGKSLFRVGELDGPANYLFGKIRDATMNGDTELVVLDSQYNEFRVYDGMGRFLLSGGGSGEGPGEFTRPTALALGMGNKIYVADIRLLRLSVFERTAQEIRVNQTVTLTELSPYDICLLQNRLVVHGLRMRNQAETDLLHVFDDELQKVTSFGRVYLTDNPTIQTAMGTGRVICVEPDKVIFVPDGLPMVFAYRVDGQPLWTTTIAEYEPFRYAEFPGRISSWTPDQGGNHAMSLVGAPNGWFILQVGLTRRDSDSRQADPELVRIDTYMLRVESGEGIYLGDDLPLLAYIDEHTAVVVEEDPVPTIDVRQVTWFFPL